MEITSFTPWLIIFVVVLLVLLRYGFEKLVALFFKLVSLQNKSLQLFTRAIILTGFNLVILLIFSLLQARLFSFSAIPTGLIILAIGAGIALLVALLSFMALKAGYGSGYGSMVARSTLDQGLTLGTFIFLSGPSEDIFFLGMAQNALTPALGWVAIIVYLVLFVAYHYANVLSKVETKREFLGTLPVRLVVACLLGVSFYLTKTLVWGLIVHNLVDSLSYLVLIGLRQQPAPPPGAN